MLILYTSTLFLSAALMFVVQPMTARMVLPLLGGSPQVWNTCVVFFQAALLAGYAYAHASTRLLGVRQQAAVHCVLVLAAAMLSPLSGITASPPLPDRSPAWWLVVALCTSVAAPVVVVCTTAPLLQRWFSCTNHPSRRDPYFLYAASNVGSLLALLAYPAVLERTLALRAQIVWWRVGYIVYALLVLACAASLWVWRAPTAAANEADEPGSAGTGAPARVQAVRWVALSFVPSSLLLGLTSYLSTDVAAFPLLWVLPLALYLLTFVLAFASVPLIPHDAATRAMPILLLPVVILMVTQISAPIWLLLPLHVAAFFCTTLVLHGELARARPAPTSLTPYYLWLAVGGVLGGVFNTFVAPMLFTNVLEYPLALCLACVLRPEARASERPRDWRQDYLLVLAIGATTAVALFASARGLASGVAVLGLLVFMSVISLTLTDKPRRFGAAMGAMFLAAQAFGGTRGTSEFAQRTFYGVYRVAVDDATQYRSLYHGTTLHGQQSLRAGARDLPRTYYHRSGPVGEWMRALQPVLAGGRVAAVGLGVGTMAAYARPGQHWTFLEIDPAVETIARDARFFTFLASCDTCQVVIGDARVSLARAPARSYTLIVLDAFSSDAIPVHLLTREAVALYVSRLTPDGVLAFHVSNRHLDLAPVLSATAAEHRLSMLVRTRGASAAEMDDELRASQWVVMSPSPATMRLLEGTTGWVPASPPDTSSSWSDDFADVLGALKWH
jgi:spermidine synthase